MTTNRPSNDTSIRTYGTVLRAKLDPRHPCNKSFGVKPRNLPEEYRDRIVEKQFQQKVTGGFSKKRNGMCDRCFMVRTETKTCNCDE